MAKYLFLKHYRGAPPMATDIPMSEWAPAAVEAHIQFMRDFADRLVETGEFVDAQALAPDGMWVRHDGADRPPVTDGPFAETKDELAGALSASPGPDGEPILEWIEVRPFLSAPPTATDGV